MKSLRFLIIFLLAYGSMDAQQTHRFNTQSSQGLTVTNSAATGLSLHYALSELTLNDVQYGEMKGQEIVLKNSFATQAEGLPNLPFENHYIAIPQGATVHLEVKELGRQVLNDIELLPAPPVQLNKAKGFPELKPNPQVFSQDIGFPSQSAVLAQTTRIRGLDVVLLQVTPFRYNPVRNQLEVIHDMDIEVRFEGGNGQFGDPRFRSPEWDGILRNLVINNDRLPASNYYDFLNEALSNGEDGCEYLIITTNDSTALFWADTLRRFRQWQGIPTKVVTTDECGNTPDSIRDYVVNAYNQWAIPPAAVLMLGGYNYSTQRGLPAYRYTVHDYYVDTYPTDNPIADVNGDSIPDMAISRIAALLPEQYQVQIEKLIRYESDPPTEAKYYDHPILTSGYEYNKWFMITSQSFDGFFRNRLGKHPTNLYMVYSQDTQYPTPPDSLWSTDVNSATALDCFGPQGEGYIPASIGALHDWIYQTEKDRLIRAFNQESFLTLFRDHSSTDTWGCPWFDMNDVLSLNNRYPTFLFSIGCNTLCYWTRTDAQPNCLVDQFNLQPSGALGGIGAVSITFSRFNDLVSWGSIDHIWPHFMSQLGSETAPDFVMPSFSLVAGKLFLTQQSFLPYSWYQPHTNATLNYFAYLGETYLNLYTEVPQPLTANIPLSILENQNELKLTVEAGAKYCLSKDDEILFVGLGTGGPQTVHLPAMPVGERFLVTLTKQNRFRMQQEVTVIPEGVPNVSIRTVTAHDNNGNGLLEEGEPVSLDLSLCNEGTVSSGSMTVLLESMSPHVTVSQASSACPSLEPDSWTTLANAFSIRISDTVPDQAEALLLFRRILNTDTLSFPYKIKLCAPTVVIDPDFQINDIQEVPLTHLVTEGHSRLSIRISNTGNAETGPLSADLLLKAPFVEVTPAHLITESLLPGETTTLTFDIHGDEPEGAWIPAHFEISHRSQRDRLDITLPYGGIYEDFEDDTLDTHFSWQNNSMEPWEFCEEDPFEGQRCMMANDQDYFTISNLIAKTVESYVIPYEGNISFYYQGSPSSILSATTSSSTSIDLPPSATWKYTVLKAPALFKQVRWSSMCEYGQSEAWGKIDHICFPPVPRTIVHAGEDRVSCHAAPVVLDDAYAYDCDSIQWMTDGDGHFETDTLGTTTYLPGTQDITNGSNLLSLLAFNDSVTYSSTTRLTYLDELDWEGDIQGDDVVNKYLTPTSHYAVKDQAGMRYTWKLEPPEAGYIHANNHEIDIVWNQNTGDMEAMLSVRNDSGCNIEPLVKRIRLTGTWIPEWETIDFNLFPNPTDGQVKLVVEKPLTGKAIVEVFNLLGERRVSKVIPRMERGETLLLDLQGLPSGLYIVRMTTAHGRCSKKVSLR